MKFKFSTRPAPEGMRRRFLGGLLGMGAAAPLSLNAQEVAASSSVQRSNFQLPSYALAQDYKSLKQSSFDTTGGNADRWSIAPGEIKTVFDAAGPGVISHIWFTIATPARLHLKEIVLRIYWDGNSKPSVEVPVGDFFGLNLGEYTVYQSAFLNCSSVKALNSYFSMPFKRSARVTVTNDGSRKVDAFYSNIDYQLVPSLPADSLYFHAQYRQVTPNVAATYTNEAAEKNLKGEKNYVFFETRGRGHLMGITLGVVQNKEAWMGEGDEMIFIDDESSPAITGTGSEDYICGAWDFGGVDGARPFAHLYNGAQLISNAERTGGRYCMYRWHADNPVTFRKYMKHTIEHGHANDRGDCFYSVAYWYQTEAATDFPSMPPVADRIPLVKSSA